MQAPLNKLIFKFEIETLFFMVAGGEPYTSISEMLGW
jgi:hypothetical protein